MKILKFRKRPELKSIRELSEAQLLAAKRAIETRAAETGLPPSYFQAGFDGDGNLSNVKLIQR